MPEVWAAAIGAVTAVAGTVYSINAQNNAIDAANQARPRAFSPINIPQTAAQALSADITNYKLSDADYARRFPALAKGRDWMAQDAANSITQGGGKSQQLIDASNKAGLGADLGNDPFTQSRNLGKPVLAMEQRDRNYFANNLALNPPRQAGLTGSDTLKLQMANTGGLSNYNASVFGNQIDRYNASIAQNYKNQQAEISGLSSLAGLISDTNTARQQSNSLDPSYYNRVASGVAGTGGLYGCNYLLPV